MNFLTRGCHHHRPIVNGSFVFDAWAFPGDILLMTSLFKYTDQLPMSAAISRSLYVSDNFKSGYSCKCFYMMHCICRCVSGDAKPLPFCMKTLIVIWGWSFACAATQLTDRRHMLLQSYGHSHAPSSPFRFSIFASSICFFWLSHSSLFLFQSR